MSKSNPIRTLERHIENDFESSNLSGSTFNELINNKLQMSTDKVQTKTSFDYKLPDIFDSGSDIKKQWFVYYSFRDPKTAKFKRFKIYKDINTFHTKEARRSRAIDISMAIADLLRDGFNPFREASHELLNQADRTISNCITQYLDHVESTSLSRHTKRKYRYELDIFKEWLILHSITTLDISEIKKEHIRNFIDYLKKERNFTSGKTPNSYLNNLRTFFNYFLHNFEDHLSKNPASRITPEKVMVKGNVAYSEKEFEAVKNEIHKSDPYLWLICQVVYYSALRNEAEAIHLKVGDIDLKNDRIRVQAEHAKGRKQQSIPIYPEFKKVLQDLNLSQYPEHYFVFGRNDQPGIKRVGEDNFARRFRKIKEALNLGSEFGIYSYKHTRACHLYDDGADLREIQLLFRHEDLHVTMNYLRTLNRVERERVFDKGRKI